MAKKGIELDGKGFVNLLRIQRWSMTLIWLNLVYNYHLQSILVLKKYDFPLKRTKTNEYLY